MNKRLSQEQINKAFKIVDSTARAVSAEPLKLTFFSDLTEPPPKQWLIKNVIARGETSSWIGPPGAAKSALLTDIAVHVSVNTDWRGYRTTGQFGVVFFALERADLVKRRLAAYRRRDGQADLPIAVAGELIGLINLSCVDIILSTLKKAEDRFSLEVGLAIIDTYNKGIAAGGGDEDKARDQNIALANLRRVLEQSNVHIAGAGHTGKDESREVSKNMLHLRGEYFERVSRTVLARDADLYGFGQQPTARAALDQH